MVRSPRRRDRGFQGFSGLQKGYVGWGFRVQVLYGIRTSRVAVRVALFTTGFQLLRCRLDAFKFRVCVYDIEVSGLHGFRVRLRFMASGFEVSGFAAGSRGRHEHIQSSQVRAGNPGRRFVARVC